MAMGQFWGGLGLPRRHSEVSGLNVLPGSNHHAAFGACGSDGCFGILPAASAGSPSESRAPRSAARCCLFILEAGRRS